MGQRLDGGRILIALGAVVLLVALFLDWYGDGGFDDFAVSAWTTFELVDLLLALLALAAIWAVLAPALPTSGMPAAPAWTLAAAGPAAFVLVALALIDPPPAAQGAEIETGAWIAFAAAAVMAAGAVLALARVSLVISIREREPGGDSRDDPDDAPPDEPAAGEDETRPMPRA